MAGFQTKLSSIVVFEHNSLAERDFKQKQSSCRVTRIALDNGHSFTLQRIREVDIKFRVFPEEFLKQVTKAQTDKYRDSDRPRLLSGSPSRDRMYTDACSLSCRSGSTFGGYCSSPGFSRTFSSCPTSYGCHQSICHGICQPACCSRHRTFNNNHCYSDCVTRIRHSPNGCRYSPASCDVRGCGGSRGRAGACGHSVCSGCGRHSSSRYTGACGYRSCRSPCGSGSDRSPGITSARSSGCTTSSLSHIVLKRVMPQEMQAFLGEERNIAITPGNSSSSSSSSSKGSTSRRSCFSTLLTRPVGESSNSSSSETKPRGIGGRDSTLSSDCTRQATVRTAGRPSCQITRGSVESRRTDRTDQHSERGDGSSGTSQRL